MASPPYCANLEEHLGSRRSQGTCPDGILLHRVKLPFKRSLTVADVPVPSRRYMRTAKTKSIRLGVERPNRLESKARERAYGIEQRMFKALSQIDVRHLTA